MNSTRYQPPHPRSLSKWAGMLPHQVAATGQATSWLRFTRGLGWFVLVTISLASLADATDPLPSWQEGASKRHILEFVESVTKASSNWHVPASQRIATFDNDGTLWSEYPLYFQFLFAIDRVKQMADIHPEWKTQQPFQSALEGDLAALMKTDGAGILNLLAVTHGDLNLADFEKAVAKWLRTARHPRFNRPYTDLVFQPMLELLAYLRTHGFKNYIVSGGDSEFLRVWTERVYGIPPERIVGSRLKTQLVFRDAIPMLFRLPEFEFFNNNERKPISIRTFIGQRPLAAFGNSDGDLEMLQWTATGPGKRLAMIVHHTDHEREWAYDRASVIG
ncbi:MAG: HAD family hydrolase, partial [Pseudomonadota bacterium]|nr:HAD family hydrolase [Pseudomonadota bacterium]